MMKSTLKGLTLLLAVSLITTHQPARGQSTGMVIGGAALTAYFGYYVTKAALETRKTDAQIIAGFEKEAKKRYAENADAVLVQIYQGRSPEQFAQFYRKCVIGAVCLVNAPLTALGGYLVKRGLATAA